MANLYQHKDSNIRKTWLLMTGFLGGFTTFSSYALESVALWRGGEYRLVVWNILGQNLLGLSGVLSGLALVWIGAKFFAR